MSASTARIRSRIEPEFKPYFPPKLTELNFSPEQLARVRRAKDPAAELAMVYRADRSAN